MLHTECICLKQDADMHKLLISTTTVLKTCNPLSALQLKTLRASSNDYFTSVSLAVHKIHK